MSDFWGCKWWGYLIESYIGDTCNVQFRNWAFSQMKANILLVDDMANSNVLNIAMKSKAQLILSTEWKPWSKRASARSWKQVGRKQICHPFVGGITEHMVDLSIYQP
jgi:hypothetical protein